MTLTAIAEYLSERAGRQFDVPFNDQMKDAVVAHRATYLTRRLEKKPHLKSYYMQSFIVDLVATNKEECAELAECGCENVLRTVKKIPKPIVIGSHPFAYIGNPTGTHPYGWTTFGTEPSLVHSPITGKKPRHTYLNEYVYVFNEKNASKLRGEGVFSDPRVLKDLQSCTDEGPCYSDTIDFPIDDELAQLIIEQILKIDLNIMSREEKIEIKADENA